MDTVAQTLGTFGLKQIEANPATRTVKFSGTVAQMEAAFQVKLLNYSHASGGYRGRVGAVHVPVALKEIVEGVFGLDNRQVARRRRKPTHDVAHANMTSLPSSWYLPSELASHYQFPEGDGRGQAIGLLEFGGGYFADDLEKFCGLAGIASLPEVVVVSADGTPTNRKDGTEGEVMLDIEVLTGVCPKAKIVVYFAQFTEQGWIAALDAVVHDETNDPGVVSVSWGNAEDTAIWTAQSIQQVNEGLQEAAMIGMTVCVAAGDDGSSDAVSDGHAHVDFPGSSPYVLSVGGTTIPVKGDKQPDIVWKEGDGLRSDRGGSTGGGVSAVFERPSWQADIKIKPVNPGAILGRCVPDLAVNADWIASPYFMVVDGIAQGNGGTSAASPLVAGLLTRINAKTKGKRVGYVTPVLYQGSKHGKGTVGAAGCTDVLNGNNNTDQLGGYSAAVGFDAVSGWGTPNGVELAKLII
jgi:kumamolisin